MISVQAGEHTVREGSAGGGVPRLSPPLLLPLLREHHGRREGGNAVFMLSFFVICCLGSPADVKKYYNRYTVPRVANPVLFTPWIRDPGWKKIRFRDPG